MRKGLGAERWRTGPPSRTTDQTRAYSRVCGEHSPLVVSTFFCVCERTWSAASRDGDRKLGKYLFCFGIIRLALRIRKPALEFGMALLLFRFVEYFFALVLVFYRAGREPV